MKSEKSKKFFSRVGFYGLLLFFALLRAVASYVFIVPNAFAPGGVGGIASIVYNVVICTTINLRKACSTPPSRFSC